MTSIISRYSTCSSICTLASISDLEFGKMKGKENQGPADQAVRPRMSQTPLVQQPPIVTRRVGSSHPSIPESGSSSAATTAAAPCSLIQRFGFIVSISPGSSKVVTSIVAPSSPLHSPILSANVSMVSSLAKRSSKAVAPSISISGVGLSSPLSLGFPFGSTGISDVRLIVGTLRPIPGSRTLVLSSYQPSYHCTVIPDLRASPWPLGVLKEVNRPVAQSISGLWVLNHGNPSTRSYALTGMTTTSGSWTGAKWSIYWTVIAVSRLSLAGTITWPSRPWVVMCAAWWGSPSLMRRFGDITMLVAPQSMSARIHCNSLCWSRIWTAWTMCDASGFAIPHKYWLDMRAFGLSKTTLGLSEIWCGSISSNVAINALIPNDCNPSSRSSILSPRARYRERLASFLVVDYRRSAGIWFVFRLLGEQGFRGSWRMYISCTGMFYVSVIWSVCIFLPTSGFS